MPAFGATSQRRLSTCDPRLQAICEAVIPYYDFSVLCGHRDQRAQDKAFRLGRSKLEWPQSKHNRQPSLAVDLAPYPVDWEAIDEFYYLAGRIEQAAAERGCPLRWGGLFTSFFDGPHFEIIEE